MKYLHPYSPFCCPFDCLSPLENGSERQGGSSPEYLYFSIVIAIGSTDTTSFCSDVAYAVYVYVRSILNRRNQQMQHFSINKNSYLYDVAAVCKILDLCAFVSFSFGFIL